MPPSLAALLALLAIPAWATDARTPATAMRKARALHAEQKRYQASLVLWSALTRWPDDLHLHQAYQRLKLTGADYGDMLGEYMRLYESSPTPQNAYLLARVDHDRERAASLVAEALKRGTRHAGLNWLNTVRRAETLAHHGQYEKALALIDSDKDGASVDPSSVRLSRAALMLRAGRLEEAWHEAEIARNLEPFEPATDAIRAYAALLQGDHRRMSDQVTRRPYWAVGDYAYADAVLAYHSIQMGLPEQARQQYERALNRPFDGLDWRGARISALDALERREEALAEAREALKEDSFNDIARLRTLQDAPDAGEEVEKIYARNPRGHAILMAMADIQCRRGRYLEAERLFTDALAYAPGIPEIWLGRAAVRTHLNDRAGARADLEQAEAIAFGNPAVAREAGRFELEAGRYENCRKNFRAYHRQTARRAERFEALMGWARCATADARPEEGLAAYEKAFELSASFSEALDAARGKSWAKSRLKDIAARYPRDAAARRVAAKEAPALEAGLAAYGDSGIEIGRPGTTEPPLARLQGDSAELPRWNAAGSDLFYSDVEGLRRYDLRKKILSWIRRTPRKLANPRMKYDGLIVARTYALAPSNDTVYASYFEYESGRARRMRLSALDLRSGRERPLYKARRLTQLDAIADGRIVAIGPPNVLIDAKHPSKTKEWGLMGCRLPVSIASDGQRIACTTANSTAPESAEILIYDVESGKQRFLQATGRRPAWSPDGKRIAYVWRERELRIISPESGEVTAYENPWAYERLEPYGIDDRETTRWSPDGRFVHYNTAEPPHEMERADIPRTIGHRRSIITEVETGRSWIAPDHRPNFEWAPLSASR